MPVGVMLLENTHMRGPGSMAHADSYAGAVLFETLPQVMGRALIHQPDLVREQVLQTGRKLVERGADVLTMNCGFGVLFQRDLAVATPATPVSSSLLLMPTLLALYGRGVGVITFDQAALSSAHLAAAGWPAKNPPAVADVQPFPEWRLLDEEESIELPMETMSRQLLETARIFVAAHGLVALVLECSGMVPFAPMLRRELQCGVHTIFDLLNLVQHGRPRLDQNAGVS